jgi:hypothetical protein
MSEKQCNKCKNVKSEEDFYMKLGRRAATCKDCHKQARRTYYAENMKVEIVPGGHPCAECGEPCPKRKIGGPARKYCSRPCAAAGNAKSYPERQRGYILSRYGITQADYARMIVEQGNRCAVCFTTNPASKSGTWHVDHCHKSGRVRGLLCARCNIGLGQFQDDPIRLRAAAIYIEKHVEG